ncbi:M1 family aminopeptidase [Nocardioides sp.]|uniref:M1 family aminopeptidase n=1 Tax=Nocardioides sp. TaxID=35761 RepID=UPI00272237AC|nr:M1 family aminopeptidase [Nocardioides sp.]MDO9455554.1 M1 family aminopeptidase [Nocardioides sp.]
MTLARRTAARIAALSLAGGLIATLQPALPAFAVDPVAGALTSGDPLFPNQGNGGYDVAHYDVKLAWTPGATLALSTIAATVTVDATTTGAPLSSYALDFEGANLTVSAVTVNGTAAGFTRVDGTGTEPPAAHKLVVTPATPVSGAFSTVITYSGVPSSHLDTDGSAEGWNATADGATFLAQPIGAMAGLPVNNTPSDKATYRFALDIPTTVTNTAGTAPASAVSNGELLSRTPNGDGTRTTWVWNQAQQMASELILISIGKYDMIESTVTLASGRVIPEWSFIDSAQSAANKTTFTTRRSQLSTIIQRLEALYGPYPGNSTGIVMDTVPSAINYALETQDRSFFPSVSSLNGNTLIHELAHQWYGDAVAPKVWNDIWINEGMATWGPSWYTSVLSATAPNPTAVETTYFNSWNNTAATSANWNTAPSGMTATSQLYGYQTYTRGAQFYEALRTAIGTPDFLTFVKTWESRYGNANGGAGDFENLAEEISGRDLTAFFTDWIYETGKPVWPFKHNLEITTPAGPALPGSTVTYTVTATNTGRVPMTPVITVDLADVLDDADLPAANLPAGTTLDGTTLTWTVPSTPVTAGSNVAQIAIPVVVDADASQRTLAATARAATLGSTCTACAASTSVDIQQLTPAPVPTITGTPKVGVALTAVTDGWPAGTTFAYQWLNAGEPIAGATASTYTPVADDLGDSLSVRVTGSKPSYLDTTRTSAAGAPVVIGTLASTPTPTIDGTPRVGTVLTAVPGTWDQGATLTYQWLADNVAIAGATGTTYTPGAGQLGARITVAVTGTKPGYTTVTRTSAASAAVAPGQQGTTPTPTITGTPKVGVQLTGAPGTWDQGTSLSYQWLADGTPIAGATGLTYTPGTGQIGSVLAFRVTGVRSGFTTIVRTSDPTAPVTAGDLANAPTPVVSGTPQVDVVLTGAPGTWDEGTTLAYQWLADGTAVPGATGLTFTPGPAQVGQVLTFAVTGTKAGYATQTRTSAPTAAVAPGVLAATPTPTISGTPQVGVSLLAFSGDWDATTLAYQWFAGDAPVATGSVFTPTAAELGSVITVAVTGTKPGYTTVTRTSAATAPVAPGTQLSTPTPTVRGTTRVGSTLQAVAGTWDEGTTLGYRWLRDGEPVAGAVNASYTLRPVDLASQLSVVVTGRKAGYDNASATSAATAPVALGTQVLRPTPRITGVAKVGRLLTIVPGAHDGGVTLAFEWYAGGNRIAGASGKTFRPSAAQVGKVIKVTVVATKPGFAQVSRTSGSTAKVVR